MAYQVSPNNTVVKSPGIVITDSAGNAWSLTPGGQVAVNGVTDQTTRNVLTLAYENGRVWQMNGDRLWWSKSSPSGAWSPTYGTSTSPLVGVASKDNALIIGANSGTGIGGSPAITDANGDRYTITPSGQVAVNGVADASTRRVIALAYDHGVVWQENEDKLWWGKTDAHASWTPTYGTANSPVQAGAINMSYLDGTSVLFENTVTPVNYVTTAVADGDRGVAFNYTAANTIGGPIRNAEGDLTLTAAGAITRVTNNGTLSTQGGIGSAHTHISVVANGLFSNAGRIDVNDSNFVSNSLSVAMRNGAFANTGVVEANGTGQTITMISAGNGSLSPIQVPFAGTVTNNGLIQVSGGATLTVSAPIVGSGTLEALSGSHIGLNGPVSAETTVHLDHAVLEFGPKGNYANPAMQFLGQVTGMNSASTVLLDGVSGASETFQVISTAGLGLCDLQVFDAANTKVADLKFVGHFQQADFTLSTIAGGTAIAFSDHPNTGSIPHS